MVLAVPRFGHPAVAWIALAPLLASLVVRGPGRDRVRPGSLRAFTLGLTAGLTYFVGTTYWTAYVMGQYGDIPFAVAAALMVALAAYLALYPAVFALVVHRLVARVGVGGLALAPAVWVTTELGRGYLFTGFPWVLLGYSQATVLPVAQLASVFGVYGLSALVALVSTSVVLLVFDRTRARWWTAGVVVTVEHERIGEVVAFGTDAKPPYARATELLRRRIVACQPEVHHVVVGHPEGQRKPAEGGEHANRGGTKSDLASDRVGASRDRTLEVPDPRSVEAERTLEHGRQRDVPGERHSRRAVAPPGTRVQVPCALVLEIRLQIAHAVLVLDFPRGPHPAAFLLDTSHFTIDARVTTPKMRFSSASFSRPVR